MMPFSVDIERRPQGAIVRLHGSVDITAEEELRRSLDPLFEDTPERVVIDMDGLEFINSLGLGVVIGFRQKLAEQGAELKLARARPDIADLLCKTRLVRLFPIHDDPDRALEAS